VPRVRGKARADHAVAILRKEIYVTAALAGALAFVGLAALGAPAAIAAAAGFAACFVIRALALHYGWSLPVYRARAC
jgi:uncharacterized membrane protein YeiH